MTCGVCSARKGGDAAAKSDCVGTGRGRKENSTQDSPDLSLACGGLGPAAHQHVAMLMPPVASHARTPSASQLTPGSPQLCGPTKATSANPTHRGEFCQGPEGAWKPMAPSPTP